MKEFYLMRHGQTRFNVQHRLQGVCDAPLTEVGIEQAKKAGQYLAKQEPIFDHVFTSTSERASDTLEIVTGRTDYERLKGLKGQDFGAFEGQPEYLTPKTLPDGQGFGDYFVQFGGESTTQVRDRMELTIRAIMESVADGSKSLLVSHGPSILQFCRRVLNPDPCGVHSVDTKSEIVKILHFKQFYKHYVFVEDGEGGRKKVLKNYIDVNVCIDMVCGDTKYELGSEE